MSQCIKGPLTLQTQESKALWPLKGDGQEVGPLQEECPAEGSACGAEAGRPGIWPKEMARTSRGQMASKLGTWGPQPLPRDGSPELQHNAK